MNFPLESVADLPDEHKQMLNAHLEQMSVRDSLKAYNKLVSMCFSECIEDLRSKNLASKEEQCTVSCTQKWLNTTARVGMRFQEMFTEMEKAAADQMGKK